MSYFFFNYNTANLTHIEYYSLIHQNDSNETPRMLINGFVGLDNNNVTHYYGNYTGSIIEGKIYAYEYSYKKNCNITSAIYLMDENDNPL